MPERDSSALSADVLAYSAVRNFYRQDREERPQRSLRRANTLLHFRQLFFQKLLVVEIAVVAVSGNEFVVSAKFDDASTVQDGDAVGVADRGNAMGDKDGRAAL